VTAHHGRHRLPENADALRMRSATVIALTSAVAAAMPTVVVSGSVPLALLIALGTVLAVAVAGFLI
jgi:hypothetical protein